MADEPEITTRQLAQTFPPAPPERFPAFELEAMKERTKNLVIVGWVFTFLIPLIGFLIGYALVFKGRHGHGVAQMVVALVLPIVLFLLAVDDAYNDIFGDDSERITIDDVLTTEDESEFNRDPDNDTGNQAYDECIADPSTTAEECAMLLSP